ncbi:hypothetical protein KI688_000807 [Linnemannia hyalina]|uniref:Uncharacterized protein n=1 Tax=Linnemannia hyalina TaxID=64524 RepID=A0A9P7Y592_9FUNG|nr:hypothetical protein KI688_000807 [Linnemannia hyalina]
MDHLVATYEDMEDLDVVFFQVVSSIFKVYKMRRIGKVGIAVELAKLDIVQDLEELLAFEDQVESWLLLESRFL